MNTTELNRRIDALRSLGEGNETRATKAQLAVDLIRQLGPYRWAGLYDVLPGEIAVIAWSGPEAPTYPRFPISKGLNGACVASRKPVIVQDVSSDPRYLTTIGGTRGEMIQPVLDTAGVVVGTIDVESDRANAFSKRDEELLALCARSLCWLWRVPGLTAGCSGPDEG
jgi:GAF domain-containing protein